jgi:CRP-like cAMP-binding protein
MSTIDYRVVTMGNQGEIISCDVLRCGGDQEAIEEVKHRVNGHALELWSGAQFLCRFPGTERQLPDAQNRPMMTAPGSELPVLRASQNGLTTDLISSKAPVDSGTAASVLERFAENLSLHMVLPRGAVEALCALQGRPKIYGAGKEVVPKRIAPTSVSLVLDGLVARTVLTAQGPRQITAFYVPGEIPDLDTLVRPNTTSGVTAIVRSHVLHINHEELRTVTDVYPELLEAFWRCTAEQAAATTEWVANLGRRSGAIRIANLICELALKCAESTPETFSFPLPVTQAVLADATGLSVVHVNRCLQSLRKANLLSFDHSIVTVHSWRELVAAAEFNPAFQLELRRQAHPAA